MNYLYKDFKNICEVNSNYLIENKEIIYLEDVLNIIRGRKYIYLDIKNNNLKEYKYKNLFFELLKLLDNYVFKYKCEPSSIYIASFYPEYIRYIISIPFEYKKGIIINSKNLEYFNENFNSNQIDFNFISIEYKIVNSIKNYFNKTIIFCWTVNDENIFNNLIENNHINGLVTDYPNKFLDILKKKRNT